MLPIIGILAGIVLAIAVHSGIWYVRHHHLDVAVSLGGLVALILALFNILTWSNRSGSDGAYIILQMFIYLWILVLIIGLIQANLLRISWWRGPLSLFFEIGVAALIGAAVNLSLQRLVILLQLDQPMETVTNPFLLSFGGLLLVLGGLRPIIRFELRGRAQ